jgi:hypothetical protein
MILVEWFFSDPYIAKLLEATQRRALKLLACIALLWASFAFDGPKFFLLAVKPGWNEEDELIDGKKLSNYLLLASFYHFLDARSPVYNGS